MHPLLFTSYCTLVFSYGLYMNDFVDFQFKAMQALDGHPREITTPVKISKIGSNTLLQLFSGRQNCIMS